MMCNGHLTHEAALEGGEGKEVNAAIGGGDQCRKIPKREDGPNVSYFKLARRNL